MSRHGLDAALAALLLIAAGACGGDGSPTQPPASGGVSIDIIDPQGLFSAHHEAIRELLETTYQQVSAQIAVDGVTILVSHDPPRTIVDYGVGGFAPSGFLIEITVDATFPGLGAVLPERLPPLAAHELHHAARWRGPGYGSTLLESMISEGLADHFAIELLGTPLQPWSKAFPQHQTEHFLDQARPELDSTTFDFNAWFFGTGGELPRWTGYTLGFRLVEDYQVANPGASAAELAHASAEIFRPE